MIQAGSNITAIDDKLQKITIDQLYHSIKFPKPEILNQVKYLRIVRNIDKNQYGLLKRKLPYFVCGIFNPNIRRIQNFAYTEYFCIDIDHVSEKGLTIDAIKEKFAKDPNVMMCFVSPGEDGLKVLFRLAERCYDATIYSIFYKTFIHRFSELHQLEQVIDKSTSDVTRACFISCDPEVYYNPEAMPIELKDYVDVANTFDVLQMKRQYDDQEKNEKKDAATGNEPMKKEDVSNEVVANIKNILKLSTAKKKEPLIYVPEELNRIMNSLTDYMTSAGIVIKEISNINYGKKIKAIIGNKEAEINIFYGKRGFSVVQSPRTGTSPEMNQLMATFIENFLQTI